MKLIGAGLPRTATLSQKAALEMLGFGPCYHMVNVISDLSLIEKWRRKFDGDDDWEGVFAGFESTVDWPGSFFYQEIAEAYPDAKVLLSVRDGEAWEASMIDTIWGVLYGDTLMRDLSAAWSRVDAGWCSYLDLLTSMWEKSGLLPEDPSRGPGQMAKAMERFNQEVQRVIPADRLLVWSAADGWEPLCEFLEVPVPDAPFPRLNDSKMFADRIYQASLTTLNGWFDKERQLAATR
jgi:hypothetical protein